MTSIIAAVAGAQEDGEERRSVQTITVATKDAEPFSFYDEEGAWQGISIELLERILEKREAAGHDPVEVEYVEAGPDGPVREHVPDLGGAGGEDDPAWNL